MARLVNTTEQAAELRRRAEAMALRHAGPPPADPESSLPAWAVQMLHELRVHQIELELQNEELRQTQQHLDEVRARYFDLYDLAPIGYFSLSEDGVILEANLHAAARLGVPRSYLVQQPFSRFVFKEDQDRFYLHHKKLAGTGSVESWDLRMVRQNGSTFWVRLDAVTAQEADETTVLRVTMADLSAKQQLEDEPRQQNAEPQ